MYPTNILKKGVTNSICRKSMLTWIPPAQIIQVASVFGEVT
jgi:hypothetical protein